MTQHLCANSFDERILRSFDLYRVLIENPMGDGWNQWGLGYYDNSLGKTGGWVCRLHDDPQIELQVSQARILKQELWHSWSSQRTLEVFRNIVMLTEPYAVHIRSGNPAKFFWRAEYFATQEEQQDVYVEYRLGGIAALTEASLQTLPTTFNPPGRTTFICKYCDSEHVVAKEPFGCRCGCSEFKVVS